MAEKTNCGGLIYDTNTMVVTGSGSTKALGVKSGSVVPAVATTTTIGGVKEMALTAVPETFADLASVQTYLASLVTAMQTAGIMATE